MRIDQGAIREILARTDIATLIGSYVSLRKRGSSLVGLCPFHGEKTPSFHVHPDRGFYKCFGCGAAGDAIAFYGRIESLTFPDAARALAQRAGVELEAENPAAARVRSEKEAIFHANDVAAKYFARQLASPEGSSAREYCSRRGIAAEAIASFGLGYAPDRWDGLVRELGAAGVAMALAEKAGLVRSGQRGYYDFYRGRLMIPTSSTTGEIVAFGGRSLDGSEPKYLNTSTTPVYTKGRGLFALDRARKVASRTGEFIVVEGYLDCIALHQAGFAHAIASLGTAFTAEQAAELRKYAERAYLCFDADAAGSAATQKSIDTLAAVGVATRIVRLPAGDDPDSYVRTHGRDGFAALLEAATPAVQFKIDCEVERLKGGFESEAAIARRAERFLATLAPVDADRWRVYVAGRLGVSVEALRASRVAAERPQAFARAGDDLRRPVAAAEPPGIERDILAVLLDEPSLVAEFAPRIAPSRFAAPRLRDMYERLVGAAAHVRVSSDVLALFAEDPAASELALRILSAGSGRRLGLEDRRAQLERALERFEEDDVVTRYRELDARINARHAAGDAVPSAERDEYRHLVEQIESRRRKRLGTKSHVQRREVT